MRRFFPAQNFTLWVLIAAAGLLGAGTEVIAAQGTLIQTSSRLRMTSEEGASPKDFFMDLGARQGVKKGDVFVVTRRIPVVNSQSGEHRDFLKVELGEIQVTFVGDFSSIGRVSRRAEAKDLPTMDSPWFMIGDEVQSKTSLPFQQ